MCNAAQIDNNRLDTVTFALDLGLEPLHLVAVEGIGNIAANVNGSHGFRLSAYQRRCSKGSRIACRSKVLAGKHSINQIREWGSVGEVVETVQIKFEIAIDTSVRWQADVKNGGFYVKSELPMPFLLDRMRGRMRREKIFGERVEGE